MSFFTPSRAARASGERPRVVVGEFTLHCRDKVREILVVTGVFREEEIRVAIELFDSVFGESAGTNDVQAVGAMNTLNAPASSDYSFLGAFTPEEELVGFACYGPTPGTDSTFDLYWIAVHPSEQGSGSGTILLNEVERRLKGLNARLVVVETSSRSDYEDTRGFYLRRGYDEAARTRDFYAPADDRITYTKRLQSRVPFGEWMAHGVETR
ncbi:MAG TPA: GNAT family N-acetyltransferase [Gemmatimonadaceae bacterium]|nr:GNAT family N-acetyltransferase [Gemmatimonadaceae bacterium]